MPDPPPDLHVLPKPDAPPVPVRLPGKRWSNWALHGIVWHCAERWIGPAVKKRNVMGNAALPILVRFPDNQETVESLFVSMERTLHRGTKEHPGMTPLNLLNYTLKKLAWTLSMDLRYGHIVMMHRVPIKGIWILHEPSNTKTWLPATPARRPTS